MIAILWALLLWQAAAIRQAPAPEGPPPTEVFLAPLTEQDDRVVVSAPSNISNSAGYDNQPRFTPDGDALLFTSMRDGRQTDIYRYDLRSRMLSQLTSTPESEYSPTVVPDRDGFSVIRVEAEGVQRLWKFPFANGKPSLILSDVKPVGYHAWADRDALVLFVLGDPPTLRIASAKTGEAQTVAERPGRCLAPTADGRVAFVHKKTAKGPWLIAELDTRSRQITPVVETLPGSEDYAVFPNGHVLMASGTKIFLSNLKDPWRELADLSSHGLRDITRMAVSPDGRWLAVVALKN